MQTSRAYYQRLQDKAEDEESKCLGGYRNRYRRRRQEEGFQRRSQVGLV